MKTTSEKNILYDQSGASAVIVAVVLTTLVGFSALAVDLGFLYAERNRIQNAADAGALAGASKLYNDDGTKVNDIGFITDAAEKVASEKNVNTGTYQVTKGHYSFGLGDLSRQFSSANVPTGETDTIDFWKVVTVNGKATKVLLTETELDEKTDFANAVQVSATLNTPSFFSNIWNYAGFSLQVESVAYIGFAGSVVEGEIDYPIAICDESIKTKVNGEDVLNCSLVRSNTSSGKPGETNTAAWSDLNTVDCSASASDVGSTMSPCGYGNKNPILINNSIGTTNGGVSSVFNPSKYYDGNSMYDCWMNGKDIDGNLLEKDAYHDNRPMEPWPMTLGVIDCCDDEGCIPKNISGCKKFVGIINVSVIWIIDKSIKNCKEAPYKMWNPIKKQWWVNEDSNGDNRWESFVDEFKLINAAGSPPIPCKDNDTSIYFLPTCEFSRPTGGTGGNNYGVLAKIPVLVN